MGFKKGLPMNKNVLLIYIILLYLPTLYAQTPVLPNNSMKSTVPPLSTGSNLPENNSTLIPDTNNTNPSTTDTVRAQQSSTTKTNCINSAGQGAVCGADATNWCTAHANAIECRNFNTNPSSQPTIKPVP
jgi:hypothetical protein